MKKINLVLSAQCLKLLLHIQFMQETRAPWPRIQMHQNEKSDPYLNKMRTKDSLEDEGLSLCVGEGPEPLSGEVLDNVQEMPVNHQYAGH